LNNIVTKFQNFWSTIDWDMNFIYRSQDLAFLIAKMSINFIFFRSSWPNMMSILCETKAFPIIFQPFSQSTSLISSHLFWPAPNSSLFSPPFQTWFYVCGFVQSKSHFKLSNPVLQNFKILIMDKFSKINGQHLYVCNNFHFSITSSFIYFVYFLILFFQPFWKYLFGVLPIV